MFIWCSILFLLGVTAFLDSLFNYGDIFRRINSVLFMLVSLGLLVRTTTKIKMRRIETYLEKIDNLQQEIGKIRRRSEDHVPSKSETPV